MYLGPTHHRFILSLGLDAALRQDMIRLDEPERSVTDSGLGQLVRTTLDGDIPALIYVTRCWKAEWIISVALWPTSHAEEVMQSSNADAAAGEVFASGWVNRWCHSGRAFDIEQFHDNRCYVAPDRRARLAAIDLPLGSAAERLMRLYPLPADHDSMTVQDRFRPRPTLA